MKNLPQLLAIFAITTTTAFPAFANTGDPGPGIDQRQSQQHQRIAQGIRSGELNQREAHRLHQEQSQIRTEERAYRADGRLTVAERRDLQQDLNQSSRRIYRQKHDAQAR
ncbi:MAG: hypothetical protein HY308_17145 [Gammaproteobacteria bacterium]|nr:hypothetical protein [Gammaproteobacteria bacterium]